QQDADARLDGTGHLVGLPADTECHDLNPCTHDDQAVDDRAITHRGPPHGHDDRCHYSCAHWRPPLSVRRTASAICAPLGMSRSSSAGENGTGTCGGVTISICAFSAPKACITTWAEMSAAIEQRGLASSTQTSRPVLVTLSS